MNNVPTASADAISTVIRQQDLADMNMNGLQIIAELIGIELGDQFNRNKQNGANYNESN